MRITHAQAQALATFVSRIRDDWDHPGIVAAITKARELGNAADIGTALCRLAANAELKTPAMLADPGAHWRDTTVATRQAPTMCPEHPTEKAGHCRACITDALTDPEAIHAKAEAVRAAMKPRPKPKPRRDPEPTDLSATRARADKEAAK